MAEGRFVAYYRVSTAKQGRRSGLGLDAQREAVRSFSTVGAGAFWPSIPRSRLARLTTAPS
jgi:DNA invertase Pin-like site-specific DNA recombinase